MATRAEQAGSVIRRAVQEVLSRGLHDPRIRGLVSVTRVEVSPDLAQASVFVSVLPEEHAELTLHGLRHAERRVQKAVAEAVRMRRVPRLAFRADDTLKKQASTLAAIARTQPPSADPPEEPAP